MARLTNAVRALARSPRGDACVRRAWAQAFRAARGGRVSCEAVGTRDGCVWETRRYRRSPRAHAPAPGLVAPAPWSHVSPRGEDDDGQKGRLHRRRADAGDQLSAAKTHLPAAKPPWLGVEWRSMTDLWLEGGKALWRLVQLSSDHLGALSGLFKHT